MRRRGLVDGARGALLALRPRDRHGRLPALGRRRRGRLPGRVRRTYEHLDRLRDDEAIRPWIAQLTRRLCIDRLRAARPSESLEDAGAHGAVDERLEQIEQAVVVRGALARLSGGLPGDPGPLLRPRRELPGDRRGARAPGRHHRLAHLTLPRPAARRAREEDPMAPDRPVDMPLGEEDIGRLLGSLPPAPAGWVAAAAELPRARRALAAIEAELAGEPERAAVTERLERRSPRPVSSRRPSRARSPARNRRRLKVAPIGLRAMAACAHCGSENPEAARFCNACGSTLTEAAPPRTEERKVVTVLFADLVGFTAGLGAARPRGRRAILSPVLRAAAGRARAPRRHGGEVHRRRGDGGLRRADHPRGRPGAGGPRGPRDPRLGRGRRSTCRSASRSTPAKRSSRSARGRSEGEAMAAGDVVNTAARLQTAAPVNGILVGERTYRATRTPSSTASVDAVDAKGKAEPVPVWEAVEARSRFGVDVGADPRTELVGRERELALLARRPRARRRARRRSSSTLVGVPGIGKSRLVVRAVRRSSTRRRTSIIWRQGRSLPYGEGVSLLGARGDGQGPGRHPRERPADGGRGSCARGRRMPSTRAEAETGCVELICGRWSASAGATETITRGEAFAAWRRFFEALAEQRPARARVRGPPLGRRRRCSTSSTTSSTGRRACRCSSSARRGPSCSSAGPGGAAASANASRVSLSPLSDAETARLIGLLLDAASCRRRRSPRCSRGRAATRSTPSSTSACCETRLIDDCPLPETVQGIIAARLDALSGEEKALLQAAAVIGKVFWLGAVAALGARHCAIEERLHTLERKEFIRRERRSSDRGRDRVRVPASARARCRVRADPARRPGRAAPARRGVDRVAGPARRPRRAWSLTTSERRRARPLGREEHAGARGAGAAGAHRGRRPGDVAGGAAGGGEVLRAGPRALPPGTPERPDLLLRVGRSRPEDTRLHDAVLEEACEGLAAAGDIEGAAEARMMLAANWWMRGAPERVWAHMRRRRGTGAGGLDLADPGARSSAPSPASRCSAPSSGGRSTSAARRWRSPSGSAAPTSPPGSS